MNGVLIVFEGVNGAGKTTIIKNITSYYDEVNIPYSVYKFPNRSGVNGTKIDKYLKGECEMSSKYDILDMFAQDRKYACEQIKADLVNGNIVLCDRYIFSAIAYQIPLHVTNVKKYCDVIGYFDKDMPMPNMTFLIEGDFLRDRGIVTTEIFHYINNHQRDLYNILKTVLNQYTTKKIEIKNCRGYQYQVAVSIITEIHKLIHY